MNKDRAKEVAIALRVSAGPKEKWNYFGNPSGPTVEWFKAQERNDLMREAADLLMDAAHK